MALAEAHGVSKDTFAARLAVLRVALGGWNIKRAAEHCGIEPENWRRWEMGKKPRDYEEICKQIAERTGYDRRWLSSGGPLIGWTSDSPVQLELAFPNGVVTPMFHRRKTDVPA